MGAEEELGLDMEWRWRWAFPRLGVHLFALDWMYFCAASESDVMLQAFPFSHVSVFPYGLYFLLVLLYWILLSFFHCTKSAFVSAYLLMSLTVLLPSYLALPRQIHDQMLHDLKALVA